MEIINITKYIWLLIVKIILKFIHLFFLDYSFLNYIVYKIINKNSLFNKEFRLSLYNFLMIHISYLQKTLI